MKKIASKKTLLKQACMLILGCLCCSVATNWILIRMADRAGNHGYIYDSGAFYRNQLFPGVLCDHDFNPDPYLVHPGEKGCLQHCDPVAAVSGGSFGVELYRRTDRV